MRSTIVGQLRLHRAQVRRGLARHREGEQRHHPVGLDLEQALHHAAGLPEAHLAVEQEEAREAVLADAEIRIAPAASRGHRAAHDRVRLRAEGVRGRRYRR